MRIVFVHGFGCSREDWDAQREALAPRHEVVTLDLPGHGNAPRGEPSIANFADEVRKHLATRTVLVGHSMGCRVVLEAARRNPERIAGLVLIDGSRLGAGDPAKAQEAARAQINAVGYPQFVDALFKAMIFKPLPQAPALLARAKRLPADFGTALFLDMVRWGAAEADAALAAVRVPLLAIQSTAMSAEGKRVMLKAGESSPWLDLLRAKVPHARIEVIPEVGHFTQLEAPDRVSRLIAGFVESLEV